MIKEIMLASSVLTNSLNSSYFYNLDSFGNKIQFSVEESYFDDYGEYYILYNLSNGTTQICNCVINGDSYEYDVNLTIEGSTTPLISDYYIYNCHDKLGFLDGLPRFTDESYFMFGGYFFLGGVNFEDIDNEYANMSYELVLKDSREEMLLILSDKDRLDLTSPYSYQYFQFDNLMSGTFSVNESPSDYCLLFQIRELYSVLNSYLTFEFSLDFTTYEFYYSLANGYSESFGNHWSDFIYSNVSNYEEIVERNNDLIAENNRLNSEHVFSNIFELVRGAINGVVDFMSIEIMPNLTIGSLFFIPVVIGVIWFILKALVL